MYVLELTFGTDPRRLEARPAHRLRLADLEAAGTLVLAGPWQDDTGALLVFDTDGAGMEEIVRNDPYYTTPGVTVLGWREWQPVAGGQLPS